MSLRKNRVFRDKQPLETTELPQGLVLNLARTSAVRSLRASNWAMAWPRSETTIELHITGNMTASKMLQSPGWVWGIRFGEILHVYRKHQDLPTEGQGDDISVLLPTSCRVHYGADGWGTALHTGSSRVRFPLGESGFFVDLILQVAVWPWESTQPPTNATGA